MEGLSKNISHEVKPTKFKFQHMMVMNSSNDTDSDPDNWKHVQDTLNKFCEEEVFVPHKRKKRTTGRRGISY